MFKEFIELLKALLKAISLPESTSNIVIFLFLLLGFASSILIQLWKLTKKVILWRNQRILNYDLQHFYSPIDVYNRTKYYISPKFQNVAPSEDDEPGRKYIASAKNKLIPLFLKKVFPFGKNDNKHFLILADSGMGKTAFLINLYISYKNKWQSPFSMEKYNIKLFPIGHEDTFEAISKIVDPSNTILLLDAFDEDIEAAKDYRKRLTEILNKTKKFHVIIITSRTQFFPTQKEEPHETGYFTGGDRGEYFFQKLYLSVFDDRDVNKYLKKRINVLIQFKKYLKAKELIKKCPNLVVRPMLLNFVDDLIKSDFEFEYSYQVYQEMIKYWLIRESNKSGIKQRFGAQENFQKELYIFSEKLSLNIYNNRQIRNGLYVSVYDNFATESLNLQDLDYHHTLTDQEIKSKSLLNRNAAGEYKFSHKSILEYFLAMEIFKNPKFYLSFDFNGMDVANTFFEELLIQLLKKQIGNFDYIPKPAGENQFELTSIKLDTFKQIKYLKIYSADQIELKFIKQFKQLRKLILLDIKFKNIYFLFRIANYYRRSTKLRQNLKFSWIKNLINPDNFSDLLSLQGPIFVQDEKELNFMFEDAPDDLLLFCLEIYALAKTPSGNRDITEFIYESIKNELIDLLNDSALKEKLNISFFDFRKIVNQKRIVKFFSWVQNDKYDNKMVAEISQFKAFVSKIEFLRTLLHECTIYY